VTPVVTLSRGRQENPYVIKVVGTRTWRAFFDVHLEGNEPVDMRCYLRLGDRTMTETWLYQYFPPKQV
jgi:glucans biosynthesis protein